MKNKIEFIAFDADDTLWENELYFQELEHRFCHLLRKYLPAPSISHAVVLAIFTPSVTGFQRICTGSQADFAPQKAPVKS